MKSVEIQRLLELMALLRHPQQGCPWDVQQTFTSIAPFTLEEAYEVVEAIEHNNLAALRDELGDLLFQVVFHARMAEEQGAFDFADVVQAIVEKMERRHPHVFGDESITSAAQQSVAWEAHKKRERAVRQADSVLSDVPINLPALTRAAKLGKRAAAVGFEWPDVQGAVHKLTEETQELTAALSAAAPKADLTDELGDVLFCVVNICRHLQIDPETALRGANHKFTRRFNHIETRLRAQGRSPEQATLSEMDALWDEAKAHERATNR